MAAAISGITFGVSLRRRADHSLRRRSKRASISSTPRTAIRSATAKKFLAARSRISRAATRLSSPPVYGRMRPGPNGAGLSRKAIFTEIDNSLCRLGMDYVDLYQIHRFDHYTPIGEMLEALHDVVKAGKARYIGASSMHAWQFARALGIAERNGWTRFVSMQNLVNLLYREEEREMLPLCKAEGIGVIPWSPQARGKLSRDWNYTSIRTETDEAFGRLFAKTDEADRNVADRVAEVAKARGIPRAQVALAWLLSKPVITAPIVGATKLHHLDDAIASVAVKLTAEEIVALEELYVPHAVVGFI